MSFHVLDVRDRDAAAGFIAEALGYAPEEERGPFEALLARLEEGEVIPAEELAAPVYDVAAIAWPARRTLADWVSGDGSEAEWAAWMEESRPATALLLKRLHERTRPLPVDEALKSSEADFLIHSDQEMELALLRPEVRIRLWQEHQETLKDQLKRAKLEFAQLDGRLKRLCTLSDQTSDPGLRENIAGFAGRVYFNGERLPLETLDQELASDASSAEQPVG